MQYGCRAVTSTLCLTCPLPRQPDCFSFWQPLAWLAACHSSAWAYTQVWCCCCPACAHFASATLPRPPPFSVHALHVCVCSPAGIKVALPCESASGRCFLQLYIEFILALQEASGAAAAGRLLPLAIMTSDDTHARTEALLKKHNNFGMKEGQVRLRLMTARQHMLRCQWRSCESLLVTD